MASGNMNEAITRIETAVDSQSELLAQLSTILDGKAGGGSNFVEIEVCTNEAVYYYDGSSWITLTDDATINAYNGVIVSLTQATDQKETSITTVEFSELDLNGWYVYIVTKGGIMDFTGTISGGSND